MNGLAGICIIVSTSLSWFLCHSIEAYPAISLLGVLMIIINNLLYAILLLHRSLIRIVYSRGTFLRTFVSSICNLSSLFFLAYSLANLNHLCSSLTWFTAVIYVTAEVDHLRFINLDSLSSSVSLSLLIR